jgi:formylglycine-generating enzyme required for sulfatase activity
MLGNVLEWAEDCIHGNYEGAPVNGSAWTEGGGCNSRVVRGGSWYNLPQNLRAATRSRFSTGIRDNRLGFRVGMTLMP